MNRRTESFRLSRRQLLQTGAAAGVVAASAGCVRRARSIVSRDVPDRVSLSITCVPAEEDPVPVEIVSHFRENLDAVGVDTTVNYRSFEEFRFDVLLNHDFDIAVGRLPGHPDPDYLYGLFHSSLVAERGWQNPYGFGSVQLDEELENQRLETGHLRRQRVGTILETVANEQPVTPLAFPIEHRIVRSDRYQGFEDREFKLSTDLLALDPGERRETLEFTIGFTAPTKNLNPLSVEHRTEEIVTGLLYDSLLVREGGEYHSWLAESIEWDDTSAVLTLRDTFWHDDEPVTAGDVAFTYKFLPDTTLGETDEDSPAPAPVFRSRSTLVSDVVERDEQTVEFTFEAREEVARRALTVPILPRHVWEERTESAEISGIGSDPQTTEAIVTSNIPPVGSGPYEYVTHSERDYVDLELVEDHFSTRATELSALEPPASAVRVVVAPSEAGAVQGVLEGDFDFTLSPIPPEDANIDEDETASVTRTQASDVYHVGYNTRRDPLSNASFRRIISMLLDKAWLASGVFDGEAVPAVTPIADEEWIPEGLEWQGTDPVTPFLGTEGTLDVGAVIAEFTEIGYQYDEDGYLRGT